MSLFEKLYQLQFDKDKYHQLDPKVRLADPNFDWELETIQELERIGLTYCELSVKVELQFTQSKCNNNVVCLSIIQLLLDSSYQLAQKLFLKVKSFCKTLLVQ